MSATSVSSILRKVQSGIRVALTPCSWTVKSLPLPANVSLLIWHAVTACTIAWSIYRDDPPVRSTWLLFGAIVLSAVVYMEATSSFEERRRGIRLRQGRVEHVEQTSIWLFSAALLLPTVFLIMLLVLVRIRRFFVARKTISLWFATSSAIALSAVGTHEVAKMTPAWSWLHGDSTASTLGGSLGIAAAVAAYFLIQAVVFGITRGLATMHLGLANGRRPWSLTNTIGTLQDNILILYTLLIAVFATIAGAFAPAALTAVVLVAIYSTRSEQRLQQMDAEREQLELVALQDALTGLPNRRGFEPQAQLALITDQAHGEPTAVLMADLDHFKDWNTRLGHFGADHLLKAVARAVRAQTRSADLLCRWGGEEIAIVLPGTGRTQAWLLAERIRGAVEAMTVEVTKPAGGTPMTVTGCTLSIGGTVSTSENGELDALQEIADQALQRAKDSGRNRVCFDGMETDQIVTDTKLTPRIRGRVFSLRRHS